MPAAGWGVKAGILAVAVHGLFNFPFHTIPVQVFVWGLPALMIGSFPGAERTPAGSPRVGSSWLSLSVAGLLAVAGALVLVHPLVRSSYFQWALAYQDAGGYRRSFHMFDAALKLIPDDTHSRIRFHRGRMLFEARDLVGAQADFEMDQKRFPCYPEGFGNLGVVYGIRAQRGEPGAMAKAQDLIETALRLRPAGRKAAGDYNSMGNLRIIAGDEAEALKNYRRALECDVANVEAAANVCNLLVRQGRRDEAASIVRAVLKERPDDPELLGLARQLGVEP